MPAHDNWRADIPIFAQTLLFAVLRPVGLLMGYRSIYARYQRVPPQA